METMITVSKTLIVITAMFLLFASLILVPGKNFASKIYFKVIPFFLGLGCLFAWFVWNGWIFVIK